MAEVSALAPSYGGVTYERLDRLAPCSGLCPTPTTRHALPAQGQVRPRRGAFHAGGVQGAGRSARRGVSDADEHRASMFHYHTGSMTRRSEKLDREVPEGYVEISPEDAVRLGLGKSARVRVISRRGEIETKVWITKRVPPAWCSSHSTLPRRQPTC